MANTKKRKRRQPPDDRKVRTAAEAAHYWTELGRSELAPSSALRVEPIDDVAAFPMVLEGCRGYAKDFGERMPAVLVAGIERVVKKLDELVSTPAASEQRDDEHGFDEIVVVGAAKFAGARRKAIARMCKGQKNHATREAFGLSRPMRTASLDEVRAACLALLAGRAGHPSHPAARMLPPADVEKARTYIAAMNEIQRRNGGRGQSAAEIARMRDVLHGAVELFYDRFGAAVELAFEDDEAMRVALLSLIPRRRDRRAAQAKPPVGGTLEDVG